MLFTFIGVGEEQVLLDSAVVCSMLFLLASVSMLKVSVCEILQTSTKG